MLKIFLRCMQNRSSSCTTTSRPGLVFADEPVMEEIASYSESTEHQRPALAHVERISKRDQENLGLSRHGHHPHLGLEDEASVS